MTRLSGKKTPPPWLNDFSNSIGILKIANFHEHFSQLLNTFTGEVFLRVRAISSCFFLFLLPPLPFLVSELPSFVCFMMKSDWKLKLMQVEGFQSMQKKQLFEFHSGLSVICGNI
jgi:hypothetical protein